MAFHEIAVPHRDILSENFSSEVYAAKLWDVYRKRGSDEYADNKTFFEKTYVTKNLQQILDSVKDRLDGKEGGHFRSITTPFGGGKTHTLIALYHKCAEWNVKPVVLVGTEMDPNDQTMWGMIEYQLTGKIDKLTGNISHGGEKLRKVLETQNQPVLILIDEYLHYVIRADSVSVGESTLGKQTIGFIQELSEAVSSFPNICVVITLPSSASEQLDNERYTELDEQLKKLAGRMKDTITPVSDHDIPKIIRRRLFSSTDVEIRDRSEQIIIDFANYCESEGLIPEEMQLSQYREEFFDTYPFLPQVIKVLYERWGTIGKFQRTRGVLRLLSLVVNSLSKSDKPFISLGDINLSDDKIRQELVDYLDPQFNSVLSKDILDVNSGAAKVNKKVPDQYKGKQLGIRAATAIFMYSHSGTVGTNGATETEVKRATCSRGIPAAQISEVLNLFRNHLFYLDASNGKYFFTKEANILKLKYDMLDNLRQDDLEIAEKTLLDKSLGINNRFEIVRWPSNSKDIRDSPRLKLIIMKENDINLIQSIYETVGKSPRIYRNSVIFLCPSDDEKNKFLNSLKNKIAWEKIKNSKIHLKEEQRARLDNEIESENRKLYTLITDYYHTLYLPEKNGPQQYHLSNPISVDKGIDEIIYDDLINEEQIHSKMGSFFLKKTYLATKEFVATSELFESMLKTPGERRPIDKDVIRSAIVDGVKNGDFEIGVIEKGNPIPKIINKQSEVSFDPGEILIDSSIFSRNDQPNSATNEKSTSTNSTHTQSIPESTELLHFDFIIPEGQVNNILVILSRIKSNYRKVKLTIDASDGSITTHDLDLIKETLRQIKAPSSLLKT